MPTIWNTEYQSYQESLLLPSPAILRSQQISTNSLPVESVRLEDISQGRELPHQKRQLLNHFPETKTKFLNLVRKFKKLMYSLLSQSIWILILAVFSSTLLWNHVIHVSKLQVHFFPIMTLIFYDNFGLKIYISRMFVSLMYYCILISGSPNGSSWHR